ncbi:hypothetical protein D3C85_1030800 [compost metagenome]
MSDTVGRPDSYQVVVASAEAVPASHLKQCISEGGRAQEVGNGESFERKPARQSVAADRDELASGFFVVFQLATRGAVQDHDFRAGEIVHCFFEYRFFGCWQLDGAKAGQGGLDHPPEHAGFGFFVMKPSADLLLNGRANTCLIPLKLGHMHEHCVWLARLTSQQSDRANECECQ